MEIEKNVFVCLDCEATGLDLERDKIVEIAAIKFTLEKKINSFESLINPKMLIPEASQKIHNITDAMVAKKPSINEILPAFLSFIENTIIIGHGINFDINIINKEAKDFDIPCKIKKQLNVDTLRLARLYGKSKFNSLENLRKHFNIEDEGAHRAFSDVLVNIKVFKHLINPFTKIEDMFKRLEKPIFMKIMPLGRYKGRQLSEVPLDYLKWLSHKDFDMDLSFSIKKEIKNRLHKLNFQKASNPFLGL